MQWHEQHMLDAAPLDIYSTCLSTGKAGLDFAVLHADDGGNRHDLKRERRGKGVLENSCTMSKPLVLESIQPYLKLIRQLHVLIQVYLGQDDLWVTVRVDELRHGCFRCCRWGHTLPPWLSTTFSKTGDRVRQGPHHLQC